MLTNDDSVDIPAQHGVKPEAGAFTHRHIADHGGIFCHKDAVRDARGKDFSVSIDGFY